MYWVIRSNKELSILSIIIYKDVQISLQLIIDANQMVSSALQKLITDATWRKNLKHTFFFQNNFDLIQISDNFAPKHTIMFAFQLVG